MDVKMYFVGCLLSNRFENGIIHLISGSNRSWFKSHNNWMHKNLRGTLIHPLRPSKLILLTSEKNGFNQDWHLANDDGRTVFVIEIFFADFKKACSKLVRNISEENIGS